LVFLDLWPNYCLELLFAYASYTLSEFLDYFLAGLFKLFKAAIIFLKLPVNVFY